MAGCAVSGEVVEPKRRLLQGLCWGALTCGLLEARLARMLRQPQHQERRGESKGYPELSRSSRACETTLARTVTSHFVPPFMCGDKSTERALRLSRFGAQAAWIRFSGWKRSL